MHPWDAALPLFVYGTLRSDGRNHAAFCADLLGVAPATTNGTLFELAAGYPALVLELPGLAQGELLTFRDPLAALARIDPLEDARPRGDGQYLRVAVPVQVTSDGRVLTAWTYVYDEARLRREPDAVRLADGLWSPVP